MKWAEIKGVRIIDDELVPAALFRPRDVSCFNVTFEFLVGVRGELGADVFTIVVCNQSWIDCFVDNGKATSRGRLVLEEYDYEKIQSHVSKLVERVHGKDWNEIVAGISRFASWEFENYSEI